MADLDASMPELKPLYILEAGRLLFGFRFNSDLARSLHVTRRAVYCWLRGIETPDLERRLHLVAMLDHRIKQISSVKDLLEKSAHKNFPFDPPLEPEPVPEPEPEPEWAPKPTIFTTNPYDLLPGETPQQRAGRQRDEAAARRNSR